MTKLEFEQKCYDAYKLDWMMSHGYSLKDYLDALILEDEEAIANDCYPEGDARDIFEALDSNFEYETGFPGGTIWVCKDEFLGAEFEDEEYMNHLFMQMPNTEEMRNFYCGQYHKVCHNCHLSVSTTAGELRAYSLTDPGNPGICILYQPNGYDYEIDVTQASVYEDGGYMTKDQERPEDVVIHVWGDATNEDYTSKEIIRREEVVAGLGTGDLN